MSSHIGPNSWVSGYSKIDGQYVCNGPVTTTSTGCTENVLNVVLFQVLSVESVSQWQM